MLKYACLGAVASLLCTPALAGQAPVATPAPRLPEGAAITAVEQMRVNGVAVTVRRIESSLPAEELLAAFRRTWQSEDAASVAPVTMQGGWHILGRRRDHWFDTLQVRQQAGGPEARLSTVDLTARAHRGTALPIPLPPTGILVSEVELSAQPAAGMQWLLECELQPAQLAAWLQARLLSRGWHAAGPAPAPPAPDGIIRSYRRDGSVLTAAVTLVDEPHRSGSALTLLLQRGAAP